MRKKIMLAGFLIVVLLFAGGVKAEATRVAVLGFEAANSNWFESSNREQKILEEITEEFNDKLSEVEDYTVLSHRRTQELLDDINARPGRRPTHSNINQLRGRTNAEQFIYGRLDRIDINEKDDFKVGPVRFSEIELTLDLSIEIINARNARTIDEFRGTGRVSQTGINIVDSEGDQIRLNTNDNDALERAISRAMDDLIVDITGEKTDQDDEETSERTVEAEVVSIVGDRLVINKGSNDGLEVGQTGNIVRYSTTSAGTSSMQNVGKADITDLDRNSGFADSFNLGLSPQEGDVIIFTIEETRKPERRNTIRVVELEDFKIEIYEPIRNRNRVTFHGTAYSYENNAELEVILGVRSFHDHNDNRTAMTGKRVSIGDWNRSSGDVARISDTINRNQSKDISWSFTNVPLNANRLSRVDLWLRTAHESDVVIELEDIDL
ncbi:MAG: hypothetical protein ACOCZY_02275 [Bacillota bacterium]